MNGNRMQSIAARMIYAAMVSDRTQSFVLPSQNGIVNLQVWPSSSIIIPHGRDAPEYT